MLHWCFVVVFGLQESRALGSRVWSRGGVQGLGSRVQSLRSAFLGSRVHDSRIWCGTPDPEPMCGILDPPPPNYLCAACRFPLCAGVHLQRAMPPYTCGCGGVVHSGLARYITQHKKHPRHTAWEASRGNQRSLSFPNSPKGSGIGDAPAANVPAAPAPAADAPAAPDRVGS